MVCCGNDEFRIAEARIGDEPSKGNGLNRIARAKNCWAMKRLGRQAARVFSSFPRR